MPPPEARLDALADAEDIRNLIARYGPLADAGDAAGVAGLWTEEGEYDVGGFGIARGREQIAALIDAPFHRALMAQGCAHVMSPPAIALDGDRATAINHSLVFRGEGEGYTVWRAAANRWELVRTADGWRVSRRVNRPLDGSDAAGALLASA